MSTRDLDYRASPFAHVAFLLSETLRGPVPVELEDTRTRDSGVAPRRGLLERLDHWLWRIREKDRERYLAQAKDLPDLEARLRELERGIGSRYY